MKRSLSSLAFIDTLGPREPHMRRQYSPADDVFHRASAVDHQKDTTLPALQQAGIERAQYVVDVGCGACHTLRLVGKLNEATVLVGIDPDETAYQKYAATDSRIRFIKAPGECLPLPDGVASHVISRGAINWMHQATGLKEMVRIMQPEGKLVLMFCGVGYSVQKLFRPARSFGLRQLAGDVAELGASLVLQVFGVQATSRETFLGRLYTHTGIRRLRSQLRRLNCKITWMQPEGRFLGLPVVWWALIERI